MKPGGGIAGTITVHGADRILVEGLTITGPGVGIRIIEGGTATVRNNMINNNQGFGVEVFDGAFALIENNVIINNDAGGISAVRARMLGDSNTIENNGFAGIEATQGSSYRSDFDTIDAGVLGEVAVLSDRDSYIDIRGSTVIGKATASFMSLLHIRPQGDSSSAVSGNATAIIQSQLLLRGTAVTGNIEADIQSFVLIAETSVNGTINGSDLSFIQFTSQVPPTNVPTCDESSICRVFLIP